MIKIIMIKMKRIVKILLAIVILLFIIVAIATFTQNNTQDLNEFGTIIGNNSNGTVYKMVCGNSFSSDTAVVILGVHSLESGMHNATYEAIKNFTKDNSLNRKFIVYFIKLNFNDSGLNTSDYNTNRHMGELLAYDYVVPDIEQYDPYVIVDVHEMEDYWEKQKYVGILDNKSATTVKYANAIGDSLNFPVYTFKSGTSLQWVSMPLAEKNHTVFLVEAPQKDAQYQKEQIARDLVRAIDNLTIIS
jgi:hypothetical protein